MYLGKKHQYQFYNVFIILLENLDGGTKCIEKETQEIKIDVYNTLKPTMY